MLETEGAIAAALAAALLAVLAYMPAVVTKALVPDPQRARSRQWLVASLILVPAAFLVVSRKTEGASALVPGAIAMSAVLSSALCLVVQRRRGGASWRGTGHVVWTLIATLLMVETLRAAPTLSAFLLLCVIAGLLALALGLSLLLGPRSNGGKSPGFEPGSREGSG